VLGHLIGVRRKEPEVGLGVSDVDDEQHGGALSSPARCG
jgi:hypothetical protein